MTHPHNQITLGKLRAALKKAKPNAVVQLGGANTGFPNDSMSYRGYYEDISFEPGPNEISAKEFLASVNDVIGKSFTGYKGGQYVMDENTPVWIAHYGSSGNAVIDVRVTSKSVAIITNHVDA